jgi:hypothetical protein
MADSAAAGAVVSATNVTIQTSFDMLTAKPRIMGKFTITGWLRWLGWVSTFAMAVCVLGMIVGWLS